jgi:hypothetical protein
MNNVDPGQLTSEIIEHLEDIDSNLIYILKELPSNDIENDLRKRIAIACHSYRCSLEDRRRETGLLAALIGETSSNAFVNDQSVVRDLAKNIIAGISFETSQLHIIVDYLHEIYQKSGEVKDAAVAILVEESMANMAGTMWSIHDVLLPYLPASCTGYDMYSWIPVKWPK